MHQNGDRYAHLEARLAELEAAHDVLARILREQVQPELLQLAGNVEQIAEELARTRGRTDA